MKMPFKASLFLFIISVISCYANAAQPTPTLAEARKNVVTKIVTAEESSDAPTLPPTDGEFELVRYQSPVGKLAAYVTKSPKAGKKYPAIVWITGGDSNAIDNVWDAQPRSNDQTASAFRKAGIVMMFPSLRGGNDNPGKREGFYGEVNDILAATDYLASLPYVDPNQIYLGGHSTGGTLAMLVAAYSERYRAVFSFGPVAAVSQYGGKYVYCDVNDKKEMALRSPIYWLNSVKSPMYVFEGTKNGNWDSIQLMLDKNTNPKIQFFKVPGHTHFSVLTPVNEKLAEQIVNGNITITQSALQNLK